MKTLLTMKHWQLFLAIFVVPLALIVVGEVQMFSSRNPMALLNLLLPALVLLAVGMGGWWYALANELTRKAPSSVRVNARLLRLFIIIPFTYIILLCLLMGLLFSGLVNAEIMKYLSLPVLLLHFFSMFCMFYGMYHLARLMKARELQRSVTFSDFSAEFFLFWFFPIGVWILQPRVNRMAEEQ